MTKTIVVNQTDEKKYPSVLTFDEVASLFTSALYSIISNADLPVFTDNFSCLDFVYPEKVKNLLKTKYGNYAVHFIRSYNYKDSNAIKNISGAWNRLRKKIDVEMLADHEIYLVDTILMTINDDKRDIGTSSTTKRAESLVSEYNKQEWLIYYDEEYQKLISDFRRKYNNKSISNIIKYSYPWFYELTKDEQNFIKVLVGILYIVLNLDEDKQAKNRNALTKHSTREDNEINQIIKQYLQCEIKTIDEEIPTENESKKNFLQTSKEVALNISKEIKKAKLLFQETVYKAESVLDDKEASYDEVRAALNDLVKELKKSEKMMGEDYERFYRNEKILVSSLIQKKKAYEIDDNDYDKILSGTSYTKK